MAVIVTMDDILEYVGLTHEDLKVRCSDEDLRKISLCISDWERYATLLRLTDEDMEDIRSRAVEQKQRTLLALQRWKQMFAFKATFSFLVSEVFLKVEDAEVAENVCYQLKSRSKARRQSSGCTTSQSLSSPSQLLPKGLTKDFTRKNLSLALQEVDNWEELGIKLQLPSYKLREIRSDLVHKGASRQKSEMLDLWLRYDMKASWETLCTALELMSGRPSDRQLASEIRAAVIDC